MRVLLLAAALRHAGSLSLAAQNKRRVLRGVLRQELEGQYPQPHRLFRYPESVSNEPPAEVRSRSAWREAR